MAAKSGEAVLADVGPQVGVADAEAVCRGQAALADLALVAVGVDLVDGLADAVEGEGGG